MTTITLRCDRCFTLLELDTHDIDRARELSVRHGWCWGVRGSRIYDRCPACQRRLARPAPHRPGGYEL